MINRYQAGTGFRKGRGCVDHIVGLTQDIASSSNKKRMTLEVFLDFEKDMVWREGVIELSRLGVKGKPLEWIHFFPSKQKYPDEDRIRALPGISLRITAEIPQGSVLSPLLFIIIMNAILNPCKRVELPMYADGIALWTTGTSSRAMTTCIQKQLNNTAKFLSANGFKISASKSQTVLFTNNSVKRSGPIPDSVSAKKLSHCLRWPPS